MFNYFIQYAIESLKCCNILMYYLLNPCTISMFVWVLNDKHLKMSIWVQL